MDKPCKHCDKADNRDNILKCDKPCSQGKAWYRCESELINVLRGIMPDLKPKGE